MFAELCTQWVHCISAWIGRSVTSTCEIGSSAGRHLSLACCSDLQDTHAAGLVKDSMSYFSESVEDVADVLVGMDDGRPNSDRLDLI